METSSKIIKLIFIFPDNVIETFAYDVEEIKANTMTMEEVINQIGKEKKIHLTVVDYSGHKINKCKTVQYYRALQPFYIRSKKELSDGCDIEIRIKQPDHTILKIQTNIWDSIFDIKNKLENLLNIPKHLLSLILDDQKLKNDMLLFHYKIRKNTLIELIQITLGGGDPGNIFVDITHPNKAITKQWNPSAPKWRIAAPGLTFEGVCTNKTCEAFNKSVLINHGYRMFDIISDSKLNKCPICKEFVETKKIAFNNCRYTYSGIKKEGEYKQKRVRIESAIEVGNHYELFDPKISGEANWLNLIIACTPITEASSIIILCALCQKPTKEKEVIIECGHKYHIPCYLQRNIPLQCLACHF